MPKYIINTIHTAGNKQQLFIASSDNISFTDNINQACKFNYMDAAIKHMRQVSKLLQHLLLEVSPLASDTPITWNNILTQQHLEKTGWDMNRLAGIARICGYNYIDWSGRIFDVVLECDTGVLTKDVPVVEHPKTETFNIKKAVVYAADAKQEFDDVIHCAWNNGYRLFTYSDVLYAITDIDDKPISILIGPLSSLGEK